MSLSGEKSSSPKDALDLFHPQVAGWFRERHGAPTEPQSAAWPLIRDGKHVLIHSPTGSGKTLAAFLSSLDSLCTGSSQVGGKGVRTLYISPLKALNYDVERNLRDPLHGISESFERAGSKMPEVRVDVRTGDTPTSARGRMTRNPPHILITTPESLYLILTSVRAREMFRTVETVIVDEIHTLCGNKRGVHLAISLERLEQIANGFQRIGLSATQRPLSEVASLLGGQKVRAVGDRPEEVELEPREVEIVDCPGSKDLRVEVFGMPESEGSNPLQSVWPILIPRVLSDIDSHDTTLIFTNSRRQAENTADRLNSVSSARESGEDVEQAVGSGERGSGVVDGPFMAHHGSLSDSVRRDIEERLKDGELPALVGTSSLELGIDIGSIDLVVQLQSPKTVTQGLQRVGRSGHSVGSISAGKIYATHVEDLLESLVVARGMLEREVEEVKSPRNSLDVLAQQIVASVAVEDWDAVDLYRMIRGSYPYSELRYGSYEGVLRLVSGHYPRELFSSLRARVHWDRKHGVLQALPGSRMVAVGSGGAIVDRGEFPVHLADRKTRIGELDEEFVYESGEGDPFVLGSQVWRITSIDDDRVIAEPAPGALPRMPFWRGDFPWRPLDLSKRLAQFRSELARRMKDYADDVSDPAEVMEWLISEYPVDEAGARQALGYIHQQLEWSGAVASDETIIVETYQDALGDSRMVIHSPFGGRVNGPWSVALAREISARMKIEPEVQVSDDGIMFRLANSDSALPVEIVNEMTAADVKDRVLDGMMDSALFGAAFRKNASRALLLPGVASWRRTPFWLQRLRSKDLLSVARSFEDFPIVLESYRDALEDVMDMPGLEDVLIGIESGEIEIKHVRSDVPSPVARGLEFYFVDHWMYQWDTPKAERGLQALNLDRSALAELFQNPSASGLLREEAISDVSALAGKTGSGMSIRSAVELAQLLEEIGDLSDDEIAERSGDDWSEWLSGLASEGRVQALDFGRGETNDWRWVPFSLYEEYRSAISDGDFGSVRKVVARYLARSGPVPLAVLESRYPIASDSMGEALDEMIASSEVARGYFSGSGEEEWMDLGMLARIQERTLSILRSEVEPVSPLRYQREVLELHGLSDSGRVEGSTDAVLGDVLEQLQGVSLPPRVWMDSVLPSRLDGFRRSQLDELLGEGEFQWIFDGDSKSESPSVAMVMPGLGRVYLPRPILDAALEDWDDLPSNLKMVYEFLVSEGVASSETVASGNPSLKLNEVSNALRDLALRGMVTCDSWDVACEIADSAGAGRRVEAGASARAIGHGAGRRDRAVRGGRSHRRDFTARRRQRSRLMAEGAHWSATRRFSFLGSEISEESAADSRARLLLKRHGVVTRRALELDGLHWDWGSIYRALSLMELRGEARRGYFVDHLPGVQFALPNALERMRRDDSSSDTSLTAVSAVDPSFVMDSRLASVCRDDDARLLRISRTPGVTVVFRGDRPVLVSHSHGRRLDAGDFPDDLLSEAVAILTERLMHRSAFSRVEVREWNGEPVLRSRGAEILMKSGFRRDYPHMVMDSVRVLSSHSR